MSCHTLFKFCVKKFGSVDIKNLKKVLRVFVSMLMSLEIYLYIDTIGELFLK